MIAKIAMRYGPVRIIPAGKAGLYVAKRIDDARAENGIDAVEYFCSLKGSNCWAVWTQNWVDSSTNGFTPGLL
jgi:hypothetical protein